MDAPTTDPFHPAVPAGTYDELLARVLPQAHTHRSWTPEDGPLPALFITHGAPPTLDDARWLDSLLTWSQSMPEPGRSSWSPRAERTPRSPSRAPRPAHRSATTSADSTGATTRCPAPPPTTSCRSSSRGEAAPPPGRPPAPAWRGRGPATPSDPCRRADAVRTSSPGPPIATRVRAAPGTTWPPRPAVLPDVLVRLRPPRDVAAGAIARRPHPSVGDPGRRVT